MTRYEKVDYLMAELKLAIGLLPECHNQRIALAKLKSSKEHVYRMKRAGK